MKPLQLSEEMQKEMVDEIEALATAPRIEASHDAAGALFGPPRLRRRLANLSDSEGAAQRHEDDKKGPLEDPINPSHYRKHPSGIECIEVTRHMNFNIGNSIKYIWRYMDKGDPIENLKKAQWYLNDEIVRLERARDR